MDSLVCYVPKNFRSGALLIIQRANEIITTYQKQGFRLSLRQLYYQFIAKDLFPDDWIDRKYNEANGLDPDTKNTMKSYKSLQSIISDARLAGRIDWKGIEDRTRETVIPSRWESPAAIVRAIAEQYRIDKWEGQEFRPEIWVEKEALAGVFEPVSRGDDVPMLCCRGYTSISEMWESAMRMVEVIRGGQKPVIIHFGDHDPSGIDMSRDIEDRLNTFVGHHTGGETIEFKRVALNMNQVREYSCPPNPAKATDSRFKEYEKAYGKESWELDALEPTVLAALAREAINGFRNRLIWNNKLGREKAERDQLGWVSGNWESIRTQATEALKKKKKP